MASVAPTINNDVSRTGAVRQVTWGPLTNANSTGVAVSMAEWSRKSFQITGTFGTVAAMVAIEGCNAPDGSGPWTTLNVSAGTAAAVNTSSFLTPSDEPIWIRPNIIAGGDGTTSVTVNAAFHRRDLATAG